MPASTGPSYLITRPPALTRASGAAVTILVSSADSGGAIGMIETVSPPHSAGPPVHIHSKEDETFYVVSGTGEFRLGNATVKGGPGFRVFGPRGVSHTYRNVGDTDLKVLIVYSPGGFEQSFLDIDAMGETATDPRATGIVMQAYGVARV